MCTCPSTGPVDHGSVKAAATAARSAVILSRDRLDLAETAFEETAFAVIADKLERAPIAFGGFPRAVQAPQQVGPRRVQKVMLIELA